MDPQQVDLLVSHYHSIQQSVLIHTDPPIANRDNAQPAGSSSDQPLAAQTGPHPEHSTIHLPSLISLLHTIQSSQPELGSDIDRILREIDAGNYTEVLSLLSRLLHGSCGVAIEKSVGSIEQHEPAGLADPPEGPVQEDSTDTGSRRRVRFLNSAGFMNIEMNSASPTPPPSASESLRSVGSSSTGSSATLSNNRPPSLQSDAWSGSCATAHPNDPPQYSASAQFDKSAYIAGRKQRRNQRTAEKIKASQSSSLVWKIEREGSDDESAAPSISLSYQPPEWMRQQTQPPPYSLEDEKRMQLPDSCLKASLQSDSDPIETETETETEIQPREYPNRRSSMMVQNLQTAPLRDSNADLTAILERSATQGLTREASLLSHASLRSRMVDSTASSVPSMSWFPSPPAFVVPDANESGREQP
ncbi:uncharacterized protein BJ171DRAFT_495221 [Polychytrium aggregatum]|uniref:uncharacterized protein n=1 Tax=Polychytrium aggregatum TaxID=110093 RepID=UPI0022FEC8E0|nr:uncharacterized protein BJ171DRAFT_495221 [Polychytrium aggregatum]KAI9206943.1 hypothetical protein BJ171DRAFT_495221 [Polychytrium aggregatum]